MTAPTFRVTWDDVPQIAGVFADIFVAMQFGQREYEYTAYDPMEDLDHVTPDMSWQMGWQGTDRCLRLYDGRHCTAVHIEVTAPKPIPFLPPVVLKQGIPS